MVGDKTVRKPRQASGRFAEEGYAVHPGLLDRELGAELRRRANAALGGLPIPGCERPHNRLVPLRWNDSIVELVLTRAAGLRSLEALIGAEDLRWISGYISSKPAHTKALWWHQDWCCWRHPVTLRPAAAQVALLCYLSDTSEHNGALRVLPGSHRRSLPLHAMLADAHAQGADLPDQHPVFSDHPGQVTLAVQAGDAVVIDYRLLHGTHPNQSSSDRDCVLLSFAPSWRRLPDDVRAHLIQHVAQPTTGGGRRDQEPRAGFVIAASSQAGGGEAFGIAVRAGGMPSRQHFGVRSRRGEQLLEPVDGAGAWRERHPPGSPGPRPCGVRWRGR